MLRRVVIAAAVALPTVAGSAQTLYIPAAANVEGLNQTRWRSDLEVKALGHDGASFTIELLESGRDNSQPVGIEGTVGPNQSIRFSDVLAVNFNFVGTGALRIRATDGRIVANSRTYNDDPRGTFGQTVPAVSEDWFTTQSGTLTLIQLSQSPDLSVGFRTNIGLVNADAEPVTVDIELFLADGTPLGTIRRRPKAHSHIQVNDVFRRVGSESVNEGYALVRAQSESGRFIAYASVVDNRSGDAVFILGSEDKAEIPIQQRLVVFESFMRPG
jgi:hypothetical protein